MSFRVLVCGLLLFHVVASLGLLAHSDKLNESSGRPQSVSNMIAEGVIPRPSLTEYMSQRQLLVNQENDMGFQSDVLLTENEQVANEIIMRAKNKEVREGLNNPYSFNPSRHIFEVLQNVKNSDLFKILQKMPKGGILHSHYAAMCSADYLVSLTYWPNLWQCTENDIIITFYFSRAQPAPEKSTNCTWTLVSEQRRRLGDSKYDEYVRKLFTLFNKDVHPKIQFRDINDVWQVMMQIFERVTPILGYAPVWKAYYKHALKEMYADNVQYLEFRSTLPPVWPIYNSFTLRCLTITPISGLRFGWSPIYRRRNCRNIFRSP